MPSLPPIPVSGDGFAAFPSGLSQSVIQIESSMRSSLFILLGFTSMSRLLPCLAAGLVLAVGGCREKREPVLASFVNSAFGTNRIVLYASGKYECFGPKEDGSVRGTPYEWGTFVGSGSNYVISIQKGLFDSPAMRTRKVYHVIKQGGVEYLFDELGKEGGDFESTQDERKLRYGWRREGG